MSKREDIIRAKKEATIKAERCMYRKYLRTSREERQIKEAKGRTYGCWTDK
jgi:hypothetical protein